MGLALVNSGSYHDNDDEPRNSNTMQFTFRTFDRSDCTLKMTGKMNVHLNVCSIGCYGSAVSAPLLARVPYFSAFLVLKFDLFNRTSVSLKGCS
jgi:hypothetical protein